MDESKIMYKYIDKKKQENEMVNLKKRTKHEKGSNGENEWQRFMINIEKLENGGSFPLKIINVHINGLKSPIKLLKLKEGRKNSTIGYSQMIHMGCKDK